MIDRKSLIDQIVENIIEQIQEGHISHGTRLPSQDKMAIQFGVSRSTLREALSKLTSIGALEIRHGEGTFVRSITDYSILSNEFSRYIHLNSEAIIHLLETRNIIEQNTVQLATDKAENTEIKQLYVFINEMEELRNNPEEYIKKDLLFHLEIAKLSGNPVLYKLLKIIRENFYEELTSSIRIPGIMESSIKTHREIVQVMENRDRKKASVVMSEHLKGPEQYLKRLNGKG